MQIGQEIESLRAGHSVAPVAREESDCRRSGTLLLTPRFDLGLVSRRSKKRQRLPVHQLRRAIRWGKSLSS